MCHRVGVHGHTRRPGIWTERISIDPLHVGVCRDGGPDSFPTSWDPERRAHLPTRIPILREGGRTASGPRRPSQPPSMECMNQYRVCQGHKDQRVRGGDVQKEPIFELALLSVMEVEIVAPINEPCQLLLCLSLTFG